MTLVEIAALDRSSGGDVSGELSRLREALGGPPATESEEHDELPQNRQQSKETKA